MMGFGSIGITPSNANSNRDFASTAQFYSGFKSIAVDSLLPSYVDPRDVRVYVVNNPEWNAMAMPNFSLYVYSGLMTDLDDDELAIALGHEVAHATHEHGHRGLKKSLLGGMGVAVIGSIASKVTKHKMDTSLQLLMSIDGGAFSNKFSRDYEDQADRVWPALRLRGRLRLHEGAGFVAEVRKEVRGSEQVLELSFRRPFDLHRNNMRNQ